MPSSTELRRAPLLAVSPEPFAQLTTGVDVVFLQQPQASAHLPFTKWRHFKEAFSPELVYEAIRCSDVSVHTCIDPFGGSGTTALTCQFAGVKPITIEVNPYLADLIEAKLQAYDVDHLVRDLGAVLCQANVMHASPRLATLPGTFVEPGLQDRWLFDREAAHRILSLSESIAGLESSRHQRLFKVLLGGTLINLSNVTVSGKGRRYRGGWQKTRHNADDVDLVFTQAASAAIAEIRRFAKRKSSAYTVVCGDSRTTLPAVDPFDLSVFSPPYPNSFDYTDVYNIELWMLGYLGAPTDNRALRARTLSSHVQVGRIFSPPPTGSQKLDDALGALTMAADRLWDRRLPAMLGAYFAEMLDIIASLQYRLHPGGTIWLVVGDSRYAGISINVARILEELTPSLGLRVTRFHTLREMRTSAQQGGQEQLAENLLVLARC